MVKPINQSQRVVLWNQTKKKNKNYSTYNFNTIEYTNNGVNKYLHNIKN